MDPWEKKLAMTWGIVLAATGAVMMFLLITGEASLNFTLVIFLMVVKFLAGFGTVIGISSFVIFMLTKFADKFNGEENKKKLNLLLFSAVAIILFLLVYQGPYKIIQSFLVTGDTDNIIDKLLFIYGIVSLMFSLYIKPLLKDEFIAVTTVTTGDMIKKGLSGTASNIKKKFFAWRKDYGKVERAEQEQLKEYLNVFRQRLAVVMMLFLGAGNVVFTIICAIFILGWLRIFYFTKRKPFRYEIYLIVGACIAICAISTLMSLVLDKTPLYVTIMGAFFFTYISQFLGLLIAAILYLRRLLGPRILKRKAQQIKNLKEEKADLEKKKEDLEKERKALLKEQKKLKKQVGKSKES
nr:hypothetical protein [Candidatus Sigynarchaeota archaeon]